MQSKENRALQRKRQLAALERIRDCRQHIAARFRGSVLPDPAELVEQLREERDGALAIDQYNGPGSSRCAGRDRDPGFS